MSRRKKWRRVWNSMPKAVQAVMIAVVGTVVGGLMLAAIFGAYHRVESILSARHRPDSAQRTQWGHFLDDIDRAQQTAVKEGRFEPLLEFFCEGEEAQYTDYENLTRRLMDDGFCLARVGRPAYPESFNGRTATIERTETWVKPCPPEQSSFEREYGRTIVIKKTDSKWCISESYVELWEPQ